MAAGATSSSGRPRRAATAPGREAFEGRDRRVDDVDRVRRPERLAQDVVDTGALEDGANQGPGDDTRTRSGGAQHDDTCRGLALDGVRNGALDPRNFEERLLGFLHTLAMADGTSLALPYPTPRCLLRRRRRRVR